MNTYEIQTTRNRTTRTVTAEGNSEYYALLKVTDTMYDTPEASDAFKPFRCAYFEEAETWVYSTARATHIVKRIRDEVCEGE